MKNFICVLMVFLILTGLPLVSYTLSPVTENGLILWLDAEDIHDESGSRISLWNAKAGKSAVQEASASMPLIKDMNGVRMVSFDGTNDFMHLDSLCIPYETTVFMVAFDYQQSDGGSGFRPLIASSDDAYNNSPAANGTGYGIGYMRNDISGFSAYLSNGSKLESVALRRAATDRLEITTLNKRQTKAVIYKNSLEVAAGDLTRPENTVYNTGYFLGGDLNHSSRHYNGDVAEILIYNRSLSYNEQIEVERYLAYKYSLVINDVNFNGLSARFRAGDLNGYKISEWQDISGQNNHAGHFLSDKQPILLSDMIDNKPVVSFSEKNSLLIPELQMGNSATVLMVGKTDKAGELFSSFSESGLNLSIPKLDTYSLLSCIIDNGKIKILKNGSPYSENTAGFEEGNGFCLMKDISGELAELCIYDRALTEDELKQAADYFKAKYMLLDDYRYIGNGSVIYDAPYVDQPYMTVAADNAIVSVVTISDGIENSSTRRILSIRSEDGGKTFGGEACIESLRAKTPSWATIYKAPNGRLFTFYNVNTGVIQQVEYRYKYSDNNGKSWSDKHYILPVLPTGINTLNPQRISSWGVSQPVSDGNKLYIGFTKFLSLTDAERRGEGFVMVSENILTETDPEKITWRMLPSEGTGIRSNNMSNLQEEHNIIAIAPDTLYSTFRTLDGYIGESYSFDGGNTWTPPQYASYEKGGNLKNPRAVPRLFTIDGEFYLWYHNHDGRDTAARNRDRNIAFISKAKISGNIVKWSQPEILAYGFDFINNIGMSYPDLIKYNGRYLLSQSDKEIARLNEIKPEIFNAFSGVFPDNNNEIFLTDPLPELIGGTFTINFTMLLPDNGKRIVISGKGGGNTGLLAVYEAGILSFELNDGFSGEQKLNIDLSAYNPVGKELNIGFVADGKADIMYAVINGSFYDGGAETQFGFQKLSRTTGNINGERLITDSSVKEIKMYNRNLFTGELE